MIYYFKFIVVIFLSLPFWGFTQNKQIEYGIVASNFMAGITAKETQIESVNIFTEFGKTIYVYQISDNGGWVLIKEYEDGHSEVSGFSDKGVLEIQNNPIFGRITNEIQNIPLTLKSAPLSQTRSITETHTVENFVPTVWGGVNQDDASGNNVYAANYYTPYHCSPGCVAITTAQLLNYYEWPIVGEGNHIYSDNYDGTAMRHQSFFDNTILEWDNLANIYHQATTTAEQQVALGRLMYNTAVSYDMNFEPTGSTANIIDGPFAYTNFFRFTSHYELVSWSSFWTRLNENILNYMPVPMAITATGTGDGHAVLITGFKVISGNNYYYINWGWWNRNGENGWYNIENWDGTGGGYNQVDGAVLDVVPIPQITSITPTGNANDFNIHWEVSGIISPEEFTLEQNKDNEGWVEVSNILTSQDYVYSNPTGQVYQFRVKSKIQGTYYADSWSEPRVYAVNGSYNGYAVFEGSQYAYARQTPQSDHDFPADYTFEAWIRVKGNNQTGDVVFDKKTTFSMYITDVTATDFSIEYKSYSNSSDILQSAATGSKLLLNQWNHIAVSKTGSTTYLFVNGQQRDINTSSVFTLTNSTNALNIGEKYVSSYTNHIKADMDNIRFSNIGRYSSSFTPDRNAYFTLDANTKGYFTFQNVHKIRFKDSSFEQSVIVKNETNYITWNCDFLDIPNFEYEITVADWVNLYPNPTNNFLYLQLNEPYTSNSSEIHYGIYDVAGKLLNEKVISANHENTHGIDVSSLNSGIYFLKLSHKSVHTNIKFIKL